MVNGPRRVAFEALLAVVCRLCAEYKLRRKLSKRTSQSEVLRAYKALLLKVHPDKGGSEEHFKELQAAKEAFDACGSSTGGRPATEGGRPTSAHPPVAKRSASEMAPSSDAVAIPSCNPCEHCDGTAAAFRVHCTACMFTYNGLKTLDDWLRFITAYELKLKEWIVLYHCATREKCRKGFFHVHLMLQFRKLINKRSSEFQIESWKPNVRPAWGNLLGETLANKKNPQPGFDRGFFYVYADKEGTVRDEHGVICVHGNYLPVWEAGARFNYSVKSLWVGTLWRHRKLPHDKCKEYVIKCREGVAHRLNNLSVIQEQEKKERIEKQRGHVIKRIRSSFRPFKVYPVLAEWRAKFEQELDRYPILIVLGESFMGKTELVKSLFRNPYQVQIADKLDFPNAFRQFDRDTHDALILDDVRDCEFFVAKQDVFQMKYDAIHEFASTTSGQFSYQHWLFQAPTAATINYSTKNRHLLQESDFLGKDRNRVLFELTEPPYENEEGDGILLPVGGRGAS